MLQILISDSEIMILKPELILVTPSMVILHHVLGNHMKLKWIVYEEGVWEMITELVAKWNMTSGK